MSDPPSDRPVDVLIIGAGISGIGMAAHLRRECPDKRFEIIERRERPGGTWDLFRYPGVRSDSDMFTLGYEFEPWRKDRAIAGGGEIQAYLSEVTAKYRISENIRFSTRAMSADWDSSEGMWTVCSEGPSGDQETTAARFLFVAAGYFDYDEAHHPLIPGIERFNGLTIHPQFWPEDLDVSGQNVIVVGSGATAVTLVPALADEAARVTMLQRTPSWYLAMPSRDHVSRLLRRTLPERWSYRLVRAINTLLQQLFFSRSRREPEKTAEFLLHRVHQELGAKFDPRDFLPPYGPWIQRLCLVPDGDLFETIRSGRGEIVTGEIESIDEHGIVLACGRHLPADIIVTATGLRLATLGKMAISLDGQPVHFPDHFYYRSCMISNLPNFAALFGYLNAAWTGRVDLVSNYLCGLLRQMDAWRADVVTPVLPGDHGLIETDSLAGFSSGYLARGRHLMPRSATTSPWQLRHDYLADRRDMRESPIDDGWLSFARLHRRAARR